MPEDALPNADIQLLSATGNRNKIEEFAAILRRLLPDLPLKVLCAADFPEVREPEETGSTFLENALIKAHHYARSTGRLSLADDSGLVVDALEGRPGVRSARYAETPQGRIDRVLHEMEEIEPELRRARFVCVAALADAQGSALSREGIIEGWIAGTRRGEGGFGYDPIFVPADQAGLPELLDAPTTRTLAQYSSEEKNSISHRARALESLAPILRRALRSGRIAD